MRELDHVDLLVICAASLPIEQNMDMIFWHMGTKATGKMRYPDKRIEHFHNLIDHPSVQWWLKKFSHAMWAVMTSPEYHAYQDERDALREANGLKVRRVRCETMKVSRW